MTISSIKATYNQAVDAYKRTNKNIKTTGLPSQNSKTTNTTSGAGVLYSGDKIDVLSQGVSKSHLFSTVIQEVSKTATATTMIQELIKNRVQKVKSSEKVSLDAIKGKAGMLEVMAAVNDSEIALQEIIAVRDKIVGAYLDILKMPL